MQLTQYNDKSKDTTLKFAKHPIFAQVLKMVDRSEFDHLVRKHGSNSYYNELKSWDHFVSLIFGILSRCDSKPDLFGHITPKREDSKRINPQKSDGGPLSKT